MSVEEFSICRYVKRHFTEHRTIESYTILVYRLFSGNHVTLLGPNKKYIAYFERMEKILVRNIFLTGS